jgi:hypothetical protein
MELCIHNYYRTSRCLHKTPNFYLLLPFKHAGTGPHIHRVVFHVWNPVLLEVLSAWTGMILCTTSKHFLSASSRRCVFQLAAVPLVAIALSNGLVGS